MKDRIKIDELSAEIQTEVGLQIILDEIESKEKYVAELEKLLTTSDVRIESDERIEERILLAKRYIDGLVFALTAFRILEHRPASSRVQSAAGRVLTEESEVE